MIFLLLAGLPGLIASGDVFAYVVVLAFLSAIVWLFGEL